MSLRELFFCGSFNFKEWQKQNVILVLDEMLLQYVVRFVRLTTKIMYVYDKKGERGHHV